MGSVAHSDFISCVPGIHDILTVTNEHKGITDSDLVKQNDAWKINWLMT
jgi:hypothetical protein